jgi:hypothetical protein
MASNSASDGDMDCPEGRIPCSSVQRSWPAWKTNLPQRDDHLCDMHPDCADGEDEFGTVAQIHRCC